MLVLKSYLTKKLTSLEVFSFIILYYTAIFFFVFLSKFVFTDVYLFHLFRYILYQRVCLFELGAKK